MGNRQSSLQSQTHRTDINSHNSNIFLQSASSAEFKNYHLIITIGAALIALLFAFLISSLVCNCFLLRRLKHGSRKIYRAGKIQERSYPNLSQQLVRPDNFV
uniref:Non-structural protein 1 peptide 2 n=1 Tax=Rotavirus B TaxID=28876 RepID=A0A2H4ZSF9_9REOV|nr:non-structural protein 1 peptide 2 [Rotavirus B]AUG44811.1 non-structural protein 1 peptide 2 [Rotavirus B]AUG44813.1 non-structural protein 1 peptide 2 [Rotavirus B]AUG44815.1 non-structural protein 1 peptide 2 [Rotavirus B]AUG44817.1 non-structural protein 1 peptide 2 [Rotavirus B]